MRNEKRYIYVLNLFEDAITAIPNDACFSSKSIHDSTSFRFDPNNKQNVYPCLIVKESAGNIQAKVANSDLAESGDTVHSLIMRVSNDAQSTPKSYSLWLQDEIRFIAHLLSKDTQ